jgi:quinohemoprotein ethanol dehydrogenase
MSGGRGGAHGAETSTDKAPLAPPAGPPKAYLLAWNPTAQKAAWRADTRGGGVLATAGNLVFQGRGRAGVLGELVAYRADDGRQVWSHETPNAITPGPVTYSVDGEQYVAVATGASMMSFGTPARMRHNGRIVAFKLHGTATFPPEAPLALPANPPQQIAAAADIAEGEKHYNQYCVRCHGFQAATGNVLPDLRRSPMLTSKEAWHNIVIAGALSERGMVGWSKFLKDEHAEAIRVYVGEQARKLQAQERAPASPAR